MLVDIAGYKVSLEKRNDSGAGFEVITLSIKAVLKMGKFLFVTLAIKAVKFLFVSLAIKADKVLFFFGHSCYKSS